MRRLIAASAGAGALIGALAPQPLYSVEIAQVISGSIVLPDSSPMAIHHGRVFSLVVDAAAVLLWLGLGVETVCRVMTAAMGALSFSALSLLGFAFTRQPLVAALLPLAMIGYRAGSDAHRYPIGLPITQYDLGANGLTAAIAALSLIALRSRWGALALGLLPGVHVAWAVGVSIIAGAGALVDRSSRAFLRAHRKWIAVGVAIVAGAFGLHLALSPAFPIGPDSEPALVQGLQRYWDVHRRPIGGTVGARVVMFAPDIAFLLIAAAAVRMGYSRRRGVRFWLAGALALAAIALTNSILDEINPGATPATFSALMPSRWLNINTVVLPALFVGLVVYPLTRQSRRRFAVTGVAATVACLAALPLIAEWGARGFELQTGIHRPEDRDLLLRARERPGIMLAYAPMFGLQLQTGRSQLLDVPLVDVLPYAPRASVPMETILNDVFGASLLRPATGEEQLADLETRWSQRTVDEWRAIRARHHVTEVMVPDFWRVQLPVIDSSTDLTIYAIPER